MDRIVPTRTVSPTARRTSGMTLIEVVTVVAIIALLMAVLLPSLAAARQKARRVACGSHLRAVGHALNLYKMGLGRYPSPGDRAPSQMFGLAIKPDDPRRYRPVTALAAIGDLAEALVYSSLGDPRALYCPSSIQTDKHSPKPYTWSHSIGRYIATWRNGHISYMYLVGLDYRLPEASFPTPQGHPTFNPATESPERRVNRVNPRAVLIGDCAVELVPPHRNLPGSNHGREGGWFYFTTGDAQWWPWDRLTAHPTSIYRWYWPRVARPPSRLDQFSAPGLGPQGPE